MEFSNELNKTWFIDLDGTIVKHNGHLNGGDEILPNVKSFFKEINKNDYVIITTARSKTYQKETEKFLFDNNIKYNQIIFDLPTGSRILINDKKPDGTKTAYCYNLKRNKGINLLK
jgi:hydroxymethylpyrimidine pyrophosphatase-like HAD family hydrolase